MYIYICIKLVGSQVEWLLGITPKIKALLLHQNSNHFSTWESQQFSQHGGNFPFLPAICWGICSRQMHLFFPAVRIVFRDFTSRKMVFWQQVLPRQRRVRISDIWIGMFFKGDFFFKISTNLSFLLVLLVWTSYIYIYMYRPFLGRFFQCK